MRLDLALVGAAPFVLEQLPMAALAGVLVVTGWRLVGLKHARHLFRAHGSLPALFGGSTFGCVACFDLLTGVVVRLALSALELVPQLRDPGGLGLRTRAAPTRPGTRTSATPTTPAWS